jgi:rod shape-determining protein MreD
MSLSSQGGFFAGGFSSAIPMTMTLIFLLLGLVPLGIADFSAIAPPLALLPLFYWSVYRPAQIGAVGAFLVGLFSDLLSGQPLGMYSLLFLVTYSMAMTQRQLFLAHSFFVLWWGFMLIATVVAMATWLLTPLFGGQFTALRPVILQVIIAAALFVPIASLCGWLENLFMGHRDAPGL